MFDRDIERDKFDKIMPLMEGLGEAVSVVKKAAKENIRLTTRQAGMLLLADDKQHWQGWDLRVGRTLVEKGLLTEREHRARLSKVSGIFKRTEAGDKLVRRLSGSPE